MTEEEYLKTYNPNKYEKPSVTTDILIFTVNENHELELLLIKRGSIQRKMGDSRGICQYDRIP